MKSQFLTLILIMLILNSGVFAQQPINIIPQPVSVKMSTKSTFRYDSNTKIICSFNPPEYEVAEYLHSFLKKYNPNIRPIVPKRDNPKYSTSNSIIFVLSSDKTLGKEGYQMDVHKDKIIISANQSAGFFYASQTLIQILMPTWKVVDGTEPLILTKDVPIGTIIDYPRFAYRGKHLDCARHFFSTAEIKQYLDLLAFHKLNTFHWHLTDDQGWRIEIKQYPLLQETASKRKQTLIGSYANTPHKYDNTEYGGYYTQEEIKEIVAYAKKLHINIIPEIEMPGHALAALSAYPNLGCEEKNYEAACTWGVFEDVFCTKEETFIFLQNVLDEVVELFPSEYIHIGGDECPKVKWKACNVCQQRIKDNNLKDEYELQSYFMNRIEKYLEGKGKKVIGWDEILEGGLKGKATVMSWQGEAGGIAAAKSGHDAIMTPTAYLYFDYYQNSADQEPLAIGGFNPLKKVYNYEPVPKELTPQEAKHIIGVQANTWTEYIKTFDKVQYMDIPRIAALSEIAWTPKEKKNYTDFLKRLDLQMGRYDNLNYNYSTSHYAITSTTSINKKTKNLEIALTTPMQKATIRYTLDGKDPNQNSTKYNKPITITQNTTIKAKAFSNHYNKEGNNQILVSPIFTQTYFISKSTGKEYKMEDINPQYAGTSTYTLTDGLFGKRQGYDQWVGTLGKDYNVELDLGEKTTIRNISINFLDEQGSWIFAPEQVSFKISTDGKQWQEMQTINTKDITPNSQSIYTYNSEVKHEIGRTRCENIPKYVTKSFDNIRYIRIEAKAIKQCPEGHPGYGYPAHCFADEIVVE